MLAVATDAKRSVCKMIIIMANVGLSRQSWNTCAAELQGRSVSDRS